MWLVLIFVVLFVLLVGTITDLKIREIPDWLTYGGVIAGLSLRLIWSVNEWSYVPVLEGVIGFAGFFLAACALYYFGQWGGGDSKALMAIGACLGINMDINHIVLAFVVNAIWIGGVYGLIWSVVLAFKNWKKFKKEFRDKLHSHGMFRAVPLIALLVLVLVSVFMKVDFVFKSMIIALVILIPLFYYLTVFVRTVESVAMYRLVSPAELTEGEWIAKDIFVNKKRVCGPGDLGVSEKQIKELKKAKIKKVLVKIGIPFVPSLLLAYVFTLFAGNPLFLLV
ncbi:hypothetical protein GF358_00290 [Candidatus Woesearchaeota archaeon]|nr:hypothetical protein [Candidatus Woesearchaeota archaeon]